MQAASIILAILLAVAVGVLWRRRSADWAVIDEHAERLSTLEQQARNAKASIEALTFCVEELQDHQFEHDQDHAPAPKPAAKRPAAKAAAPAAPAAPPVQPVKKIAPAKKAAAKRPPTKKATPVSAR